MEATIGDIPTRLTDRDPLAGSSWSDDRTVQGFVQSPPNASLLAFAAQELRTGGRLLDIGCGAGRNSVPLAQMGWRVAAADLSSAMLIAAAHRTGEAAITDRIRLVQASMNALPFAADSFDFVVAHGIWNLARSRQEFRTGVAEASRVARAGAALFLFTFSRHTLEASAEPLAGESFVFTQFSGQPQCFLTDDEIVAELAAAGFSADSSFPLRELNRPRGGIRTSAAPVIYEGVFRLRR